MILVWNSNKWWNIGPGYHLCRAYIVMLLPKIFLIVVLNFWYKHLKKSQIKTRFLILSIKIVIGMNNLAFTMTTKYKILR